MDRILFVDDDPDLLEAYQVLLGGHFDIRVALGGKRGLAELEKNGPFAVVVSDMRMPIQDGARFLAQVEQRAPDAVRMLLTGYADLDAAMDAVNEGHIFRFLTKPCERNLLVQILSAGVAQHHLLTSQRDLLERTLLGSIRVLTEVLSAASPEAFGRSLRLSRAVRHIAGRLGAPAGWRLEAAATLSQLGCVTVPPALLLQAYVGSKLSPEDQVRYEAHPQIASELVASIPRLEEVAWVLGRQLQKEIPALVPGMTAAASAPLVREAKILKLAVAFDNYRVRSLTEEEAIGRLRIRHAEFDREMVDALADMKADHSGMELRRIPVYNLAIGMVLKQEIRDRDGVLKVARGQEITSTLRVKLWNLSNAGLIDSQVLVLVDMERHAAA